MKLKTLALTLILFTTSSQAEMTAQDYVTQLRATADRWERDAMSLMDGRVPMDRREMIGRAMTWFKAAEDIRILTNEQIPVRTRENWPKPWPVTDIRGTAKLGDLLIPGFGGQINKELTRPSLPEWSLP